MAHPSDWASFRLSDDALWRLALDACTFVNSPYTRALRRSMVSGGSDFLDLKPDPLNYDEPWLLAEDLQVSGLVHKYPWKHGWTDDQRKQVAIDELRRCEDRCKLTNREFLSGFPNGQPRHLNILFEMREKIRKLLGKFNVDDVLARGRFGPGLVLGLSDVTETMFYDKLQSVVTLTPSLTKYLGVLRYEFPGWARTHDVVFVTDNYGDAVAVGDFKSQVCEGNRITFVPKNARTFRPIAIEPLLNQFLQLGTGSVLQERLKRWGINVKPRSLKPKAPVTLSLNYPDWQQADKQRQLAKLGSRHPWLVSTVDLKSASDTVSYRLVEFLLPPDWFHWLNQLRSPSGNLDGETIHYEKFSSMGNGYTFEIETLIFSAAVKCLTEDNLWGVFGDDIACPTVIVEELLSLLNYIGFDANMSKSFFTSHPFRESCGEDYFSGCNVRPLYLKDQISGLDLLSFGSRLWFGPTRVARFLHSRLCRIIPKSVQKRYWGPVGSPAAWQGPDSPGDCPAFSSDTQSAYWTLIVPVFSTFGRKPRGLAGVLHSVESGLSSGQVPRRDRKSVV